jgi:putative colanic acid biosynthesis acetyltransferase WcaF
MKAATASLELGRVDLSQHELQGYLPGRPYWFRALWLVVEALTLLNPMFVPYGLKAAILRLFGARIGRGVVIKPGVHIKYPWHLSVGDNVWIGERAWIDNLATVRIDANACISQGAYLCTGNHDWSDPHMGLIVEPITIEAGAWVGAFARVAPGITIGREAVITLASVVLADAQPGGIYGGNPAHRMKERRLRR